MSANAGDKCQSGAGGAVTMKGGTSMAAPIVAGAAAIIRQYLAEGYYPCGKRSEAALAPSSALMRALVINSAQELGGAQDLMDCSSGQCQEAHKYRAIGRSDAGYPNAYQGYGVVSLANVLSFEKSNFKLLLPGRTTTQATFGDPILNSMGEKQTVGRDVCQTYPHCSLTH